MKSSRNEAEYAVNFLLQGPGITGSQAESQAKSKQIDCDCRTEKGLFSSYLSK